jgi:hypothetical protein
MCRQKGCEHWGKGSSGSSLSSQNHNYSMYTRIIGDSLVNLGVDTSSWSTDMCYVIKYIYFRVEGGHIIISIPSALPRTMFQECSPRTARQKQRVIISKTLIQDLVIAK